MYHERSPRANTPRQTTYIEAISAMDRMIGMNAIKEARYVHIILAVPPLVRPNKAELFKFKRELDLLCSFAQDRIAALTYFS